MNDKELGVIATKLVLELEEGDKSSHERQEIIFRELKATRDAGIKFGYENAETIGQLKFDRLSQPAL